MTKETFDSYVERLRMGMAVQQEAEVMDGDTDMAEEKRSSRLTYWFPRLWDSGLPVPKTHIIHTDLDPFAVLDWAIDDKPDERARLNWLVIQVRRAADILGYPAFLRTDFFSGKHSWSETCYLAQRDEVGQHIYNLIEESHAVSMIGLPTDVWVVREFLELENAFTAFRGMPISREYRFFVEGGKIIHEQPYWPPGAIHSASRADWQDILVDYNDMSLPVVDEARALARRVADVFDGRGQWSVDICRTKGGKFYVTDMAIGERSYLWHTAVSDPAKLTSRVGTSVDTPKIKR